MTQTGFLSNSSSLPRKLASQTEMPWRQNPTSSAGCQVAAGDRSSRKAAMRTDTTVLIVGAGPVGMSLALLLDRLGVDSIVVERSPGTTIHPKARGLNARTMEIFRTWGIEKSIRARSFSRNGP